MTKRLTDEECRILIAADEGRLFLNAAGRWEIDLEERPDRRSRENLRKRGLILSIWDNGPGYRITAKGKGRLRDELLARRMERSA